MLHQEENLSDHALDLLLSTALEAGLATSYVDAMDKVRAIADETTRAVMALKAEEDRTAA